MFFSDVPEFKAVVGEALAGEFVAATDDNKTRESLKECFSAFMNCNPETLKEKLNGLVQRLEAMGQFI